MKKKTSHSKTSHKTTVHHQTKRHIRHTKAHSEHRRRSRDIYMNAFARFTSSLIDQTAGLLKQGVRFTSEQTEKGKRAIKDAAMDLIDGSSSRLHYAVRQSSHLMRKGVQQV
jgi:hypothetical protein